MMTLSTGTMLGTACIILAIVLIASSRYRYWLAFMLAGAIFWTGFELLRLFMQWTFDLNIWSAYAGTLFLVVIAIAGVYMYSHYQTVKFHHQRLKCIEHTPVYEDDRQYTG